MAGDQGDYAAAQSLNQECLNLFREMGDMYGIALALNNLGGVALALGDYAAARALQEESLSLQREMDDKRGISNSLNNLGDVALMQGEVAAARALYEECLALCKKIDEKASMAHALLGLGLAASLSSLEAREYILRSLRLRAEMGGQAPQISSLIGMAGLTLRDGNPVQAAQWLGAINSVLKTLNVPRELHEPQRVCADVILIFA